MKIEEFKVFDHPPLEEFGEALIHVQEKSWSWGHCTNERCAHASHSPYAQGLSLFILCEPAEKEYPHFGWLFRLPDGRKIGYKHWQERGHHYWPTAIVRFIQEP